MFVFKAAVVGAGTMGGEIAQAIAAADIPVVLKDIDQKFVDHGLEKAREVTKGQLDRLVKKEKLTQEQADARLEEVMGRIDGHHLLRRLRRRRLRHRGGAGEDGDQAGRSSPSSTRSRPATRSSPRTPPSLSITEMGDATLRPEKVVGFHFFYPASVMPLVEIVEGDDTDPEVDPGRVQLRPGDPQAADHLRRGPRLRRQPHPQLGGRRDLARPGGAGPLDQEDRRGGRRRQRRADGPVLPRRPARPRHRLPRRRAPATSPTATRFYVHKGMRKLVEDGKLGAKTGGERLLQGRRAADPRRRATRRRGARRAAAAEGAASRPASCSRRASAPCATSTSG